MITYFIGVIIIGGLLITVAVMDHIIAIDNFKKSLDEIAQEDGVKRVWYNDRYDVWVETDDGNVIKL